MNLIHLKHTDIDKEKWDLSIANSTHPFIYAESWFLDIVSPQWEAIISRDYQTLWPLTINRKFKLPVIMQPLFTQQLGIFSSGILDSNIVTQFYKTNPYPIITMQSQSMTNWMETGTLKTKRNYILPLDKNYYELKQAFRKDRKQSLKKALKEPKRCQYQFSEDAFIEFIRQHNNFQMPEKHLTLLHQIIKQALEQKCGFILSISDDFENPLSMAFFLKKHNRIINLVGDSSSEGYAKEAMFRILNQVIQDYASSEYVLDFEGSEIEGVASFYRSFGATLAPYQCLENPLFSNWQKLTHFLSK